MKMPFGAHKGSNVEDLPTDYLKWLMTIDLGSWLRSGVEAEYQSRMVWRENSQDISLHMVEELVRGGLKLQAEKFHSPIQDPGNHDVMVEYDKAARWILRQARRLLTL
jgi:hypothetical protein